MVLFAGEHPAQGSLWVKITQWPWGWQSLLAAELLGRMKGGEHDGQWKDLAINTLQGTGNRTDKIPIPPAQMIAHVNHVLEAAGLLGVWKELPVGRLLGPVFSSARPMSRIWRKRRRGRGGEMRSVDRLQFTLQSDLKPQCTISALYPPSTVLITPSI